MRFKSCSRQSVLALSLGFVYATTVPTIHYTGISEIPQTLVPRDLSPSAVYYARTTKENGVDVYLGSVLFNNFRKRAGDCSDQMTQECQESLMTILGTNGAETLPPKVEKRQAALLALAIIEAPIIFVMIMYLYHNLHDDGPKTTNLHVPGSALSGAAEAMTASSFVVKPYLSTATTVSRTLTETTADWRSPLVTQYPGKEPVLLLFSKDMAKRFQELLEKTAVPTCGRIGNLKRQAFPAGSELCGFVGVAGAAQPGMDLELLQVMGNPMNWVLVFPPDLAHILAAARQILRDALHIGWALDFYIDHTLEISPFIFLLVVGWVKFGERVGEVNTIRKEFLETVTNRPTSTTTSTNSSSSVSFSTSSSKKPCRTDVLEIQKSPDCVDGDCDGLNVDKKCIAKGEKKDCLCWLWFNVTGYPQVMAPDYFKQLSLLWVQDEYTPDCKDSGETVAMDPELFKTAYGIACDNIGIFTERDLTQTIDDFKGYKVKPPYDNYNFEFSWKRKQGACQNNKWWTNASQECRLWYNAFIGNGTCWNKEKATLARSGTVDFECGTAKYFIDHAADDKSAGSLDPWRVRLGLAKCSGEETDIKVDLQLDLQLQVANTWCAFLGDGFSTKTFTKQWTQNDWQVMSKTRDNWSAKSLGYDHNLRWKAKKEPACQVSQRPGFYKDVCVDTYMALTKSPECKGPHGGVKRYGTIETLCGTAWSFIGLKGMEEHYLAEINKGIPYAFDADEHIDVLNSFWKLVTHSSWDSAVVQGGRTVHRDEGKWTIIVDLFDHNQEKLKTWTLTEKNGKTDIQYFTPTGTLTLRNFKFEPGDKQPDPEMHWWWESNNDVISAGLRRGDGMIFKNKAWEDKNPGKFRSAEDIDEPYMDHLNACNKWDWEKEERGNRKWKSWTCLLSIPYFNRVF